jgi:RNA polymerase-binding transcription factor DksA
MTTAELESYRQQLLGLGRRLEEDVAGLAHEALQKTGGADSGNLSNTPMHLADLGTDHFEQEVTLSVLENKEQTLEEVAAALRRIEQGNFGRCEGCSAEIPGERLQAVPFTRLCIECARKAETEPSPEGP